jgi:hypothetical protein
MASQEPKKDWSVERCRTRYRVDLRIKVNYIRDGQPVFAFGQGSDVSEGGMAGYIPTELDLGEIVDLEVKLPYSRQPVKIKAAVRNRNGFRYGLEYMLIQPEDREQLIRSLKALALVQ